MMSTTNKKQKRMRGIPLIRDEVKKKRTVSLTDTAWELLKEEAKRQDTSISEIIETLAREIGG